MKKSFEKPIYVTRPFLPPLEEFTRGLGPIWESQWVTNNGPMVQRFARELGDFFGTENICLFNNGSLALQIALRGMGIAGEVITTPFTFVASAHALVLNGIQPVFVDIEPDYYTLDPERVEAAITSRTAAILAVHVYGHPCRLSELADVAKRHRIKLIYDAAHSFGVTAEGNSIARYGDLSVFSFHATKPFHSLEGGMAVFQEKGLGTAFDSLKNHGIGMDEEVKTVGTNAKMNEIQALMGSLVLKYLGEITGKRQEVADLYRRCLREVPGIRLVRPLPASIRYNYAYMPVEVDEEEFGMSRDALWEKLRERNVFSRRYFYPLVCDFAPYRNIPVADPLGVARRVAGRILALPIYDALDLAEVEILCGMIREFQRGQRRHIAGGGPR